MKREDLIVGRVYYIGGSISDWIVEFAGMDDSNIVLSNGSLSIQSMHFYAGTNSPWGSIDLFLSEIRESIEEEIEWLRICQKEKRFVQKPEYITPKHIIFN